MIIKTASLTPASLQVIQNKGTEPPFTGEYGDVAGAGTYLCRQCGLALFRADSQFHSGCGWPSFDEEILGTLRREPDKDGLRIEILCAHCCGHLGHEFTGEGFTKKNIRCCVNSLSLDFVADPQVLQTEEAIFAGGCFWGVEYYFRQLSGVLKTEVGYTGGREQNPTYQQICEKATHHLEAVRVIYDLQQTNYETVAKYFLEIHDPTQANGQGPDIGEQYLSAMFYYDDAQKQTIEKLLDQLCQGGYSIATKILPVSVFWRAEEYHQRYYNKMNKIPYCHGYTQRF